MTQNERIMAALYAGKTFSQKQAAQYGIKNLRARVSELRGEHPYLVFERILNSNGVPAYRLS